MVKNVNAEDTGEVTLYAQWRAPSSGGRNTSNATHAAGKGYKGMSDNLKNAENIYLRGIRDGAVQEVLDCCYMGDTYAQHSTGVKDGKEGFSEFFEDFFKRNPKRDIWIVRSLSDGPYVFLHVYQNLNEGAVSVMTIVSSLRSILDTPVFAVTEGTSPAISYNYGAARPANVKKSVRIMMSLALPYTFLVWLFDHAPAGMVYTDFQQ